MGKADSQKVWEWERNVRNMGVYLNPGNSGFAGIRNDVYVDKSGLVCLINETIETPSLKGSSMSDPLTWNIHMISHTERT